ncbi:MAG: CotH kinase family protein [Gammaproteobacteria bacterium]
MVALFFQLPIQDDKLARHWHSQLWGLNQQHYLEFKEKLKARAYPNIENQFALNIQAAFSPEPKPSIVGGLYDHPLSINLSIENDEDTLIYFTLDGSIPTKHSLRYTSPISINETTVLRFRSYKTGFLPGITVTHTYLLNADIRLPIVSLVTDPVNLWNKYSGIYKNSLMRGRAWEREAFAEYFDNQNSLSLRWPVGLRINGGWSRALPKKSFRLTYPLSSLPETTIDNILTTGSPVDQRTVVLRNTTDFRLRDVLFERLYSKAGGYTSSFIPVMVFLNGKMWGMYNIREKIDDDYLQRHAGKGQYLLIDLWIDQFDRFSHSTDIFEPIREFFATHDLSNDDEFEKAAQLIDIDNFTDYWLFNIYAANVDWPHNNIYAFKNLEGEDTRWRWVAWDADDSFGAGNEAGYEHDTLALATRSELRSDLFPSYASDDEELLQSTLIIRGLLRNEAYKRKFISRFCELQNSILAPENVEAELDKIIEVISHDLPLDLKRWSISEKRYHDEVRNIRDFVAKRPEYLYRYFQNKFQPELIVGRERCFGPDEGGETFDLHRNLTPQPE